MSSNRFFAAPLASLLLLGCASVPDDLGRGEIRQQVTARGLAVGADADADASKELLQQWLTAPLTRDRAIQIALLNNPELRTRYAQLGLAAADVYEAGRLANPVLSLTQLSAGSAAHSQLTLGIAIDFTDLLMLRSRSRFAATQLAIMQARLGAATLNLAADVEAAYWRVVAAEQAVLLRKNQADTASLSAALADRYFAAGNLRARDQALQQANAAQAGVQLAASRLDAAMARGAFSRLLGLRATQMQWQLGETLQLPPSGEAALADLLALAERSRLDLAAARQQADALAARNGLSRHTRLLGSVSVGAEHERDFDGSRHSGPSASLQLPLFDWGQGRVLRAQAQLDQAEAQLSALQADADSEVSAAQAQLQAARARIDLYRQQLLPAREAVSEQLLREVNYMLSSAFELTLAQQQSSDAEAGYLDALRDYWVARAELARAVGTRVPEPVLTNDRGDAPPQPAAEPAPAAVPAKPDAPATSEPPHQHHNHGAQR